MSSQLISPECKRLKTTYHSLVGTLSAALGAEPRAYDELAQKCGYPNWTKVLKAANIDAHLKNAEFNEGTEMDLLERKYRKNTMYMDAIRQAQEQKKYTSNLQGTIQDTNLSALRNLNADLMTSKRMATINTEAAVRLEDKCTYLRSFVVALCIAILVVVASRVGLPFPIATALIGVVAIALVITLIVHAVGNANRYRMLFPEREWPLHVDSGSADEEVCGCDTGGDGTASTSQ